MSQLPRIAFDVAQARHAAAPESRAFAPLALALQQRGQLTDAMRLLRAGLERHPRYVSAWVLLGHCCRDQQLDEEAEAAFARVLELDPENVLALRYRAERARRRGAPERALELLRRALEIDPFDREVQADLGLLSAAAERGFQTEAAPAAEPAVPIVPERATPPASESVPPPDPLPLEELLSPRGIAEVAPPTIDLRRVSPGSETPPFVWPPPAEELQGPEPESPAPAPVEPPRPGWRVDREQDRITVSPDAPPPIRGPIRSIDDRLWQEQRSRAGTPPPVTSGPASVPAPASPPTRLGVSRPAPPPPVVASPPAPTGGEFATLTLARIYESQGYLQKAQTIYSELRRRHPEDAEVAARLAALERRLAAAAPAPETTVAPASPAPQPAAMVLPSAETEPDFDTEWRLLDAAGMATPTETAGRLRDRAHEVRREQRAREHTFIGNPPAEAAPLPAPPAPTAEDLSRGHPDFERFLNYVRSLRPPAEP